MSEVEKTPAVVIEEESSANEPPVIEKTPAPPAVPGVLTPEILAPAPTPETEPADAQKEVSEVIEEQVETGNDSSQTESSQAKVSKEESSTAQEDKAPSVEDIQQALVAAKEEMKETESTQAVADKPESSRLLEVVQAVPTSAERAEKALEVAEEQAKDEAPVEVIETTERETPVPLIVPAPDEKPLVVTTSAGSATDVPPEVTEVETFVAPSEAKLTQVPHPTAEIPVIIVSGQDKADEEATETVALIAPEVPAAATVPVETQGVAQALDEEQADSGVEGASSEAVRDVATSSAVRTNDAEQNMTLTRMKYQRPFRERFLLYFASCRNYEMIEESAGSSSSSSSSDNDLVLSGEPRKRDRIRKHLLRRSFMRLLLGRQYVKVLHPLIDEATEGTRMGEVPPARVQFYQGPSHQRSKARHRGRHAVHFDEANSRLSRRVLRHMDKDKSRGSRRGRPQYL